MNHFWGSSGPVPGISQACCLGDAKDRERCSHDSSSKFPYLVESWIGESRRCLWLHTTCPPTSVTFWVAPGHRWDAPGSLLWAPALQGITHCTWLGGHLRQWLFLKVYTLRQRFGSSLFSLLLSQAPTNFSSDCPGWGAWGSRACWGAMNKVERAVGQKSLHRQCSVTLGGTVLSWFSWTWEILNAPNCLNDGDLLGWTPSALFAIPGREKGIQREVHTQLSVLGSASWWRRDMCLRCVWVPFQMQDE